MAYTSIADFFTELKYHVVEPAHETFLFGNTAAKNVIDISDDSRANSSTHQSSMLRYGVENWRDLISSSIASLSGSLAYAFTGNDDLKALIKTDETSLTGIFADLHDYMMAGENLAGTVTFTNGATGVTGVATDFLTSIGGPGAVLNKWVYYEADGYLYAKEVASVTNDTTLTLSANYAGAGGIGGKIRLVQTIEEQNFTRGAVTASALNSGNGTILVRTTDWTPIKFDIEDGIASAIKFKCVADSTTGTGKIGSSVWSVYYEGENPFDSLSIPTALSGRDIYVNSWTAEEVVLVNNPTFEAYLSTAGVNKFTNWIIKTGDDARFSQHNEDVPNNYIYRAVRKSMDSVSLPQGEGYSCKITFGAETYIYQRLSNLGKVFLPKQAYLFSAMVITDDAIGPGDVYITIGNSETTHVTLTAAWQRVYGIFYTEEFNESTLDIKITRTISTTGNAYIANLIVCPCDYFNGRQFVVVEGSHDATGGYRNNDFIKDDIFTATDTVAGFGKYSYWINRFMRNQASVGYFLPTSSNPTIADPA